MHGKPGRCFVQPSLVLCACSFRVRRAKFFWWGGKGCALVLGNR